MRFCEIKFLLRTGVPEETDLRRKTLCWDPTRGRAGPVRNSVTDVVWFLTQGWDSYHGLSLNSILFEASPHAQSRVLSERILSTLAYFHGI